MGDLNIEIPAFEAPMETNLPKGNPSLTCPECDNPFEIPSNIDLSKDSVLMNCPHCNVRLHLSKNI